MGGFVSAAVVGAVANGYAANKGAKAQKKASAKAIAAEERIADKQLAFAKQQWKDQQRLQRPWRTAGVNALKEISKGVYELPEAFSYSAEDFSADPGYAFRMQEGMKALDRQAAARGGLISGNALRAAQRYGQDMGSQEYQNAYNRAITEYNARVQRSDTGYNRLAGQAGIGQTATGQLAQAGQNLTGQSMNALGNFGSSMGQHITDAGNARASGYMGTANALTNALSTGLNYYKNKKYIDMLNKPSGGSSTPFWQQPQYGYSVTGPRG